MMIFDDFGMIVSLYPLHVTARRSSLDVSVYPRNERINIFIMAVDAYQSYSHESERVN